MPLLPIITRKYFDSEIKTIKTGHESDLTKVYDLVQAANKDAEHQRAVARNARKALKRVTETTNQILLRGSRTGGRSEIIVQSDGTFTGAPNDYRDRVTLIREIRFKYKGISENGGNNLVERMVEFKTTFTLGRGFRAREIDDPIRLRDGAEDETPEDVEVIPEEVETEEEVEIEETSPELKFIQEFLRFNKLDGSGAEKIGTMANLEGGLAISLSPVKDDSGEVVNIGIRIHDWHKEKWTPTWNELGGEENEIAGLKELTYIPLDSNGQEMDPVVVPGERAIAFYLNAVGAEKEGRPIVNSAGLNILDNIERIINDLREYNRYFASPTPHLQTEDAEEMNAVIETMEEDDNVRMGSLMVSPGVLTIVEATGKGIEALNNEMELDIKTLSGNTGISTHWLGWPDLTTNKSTAGEQKEPLSIAISSEQAIYEENFSELYDKSIRMMNEESGIFSVPLEEGIIKAMAKVLTEAEMTVIEKIILPMTQSRQLPLKILLEMLEHILGHSTEEILAMVSEMETERFGPGDASPFPDDEDAITAAIEAARNEDVNLAGAGL